MLNSSQPMEIQVWPIERLVRYARNPRKNDSAVDRMCSSIREFGFKIPVLARSDGEVVDGHLRLKAARKLGITEVPVMLCDEWTPAQVKAFRLMVNRSVSWASWDEKLLARELHRIGEQLWSARNAGIPLAPEQVVSEVMERAAEYYYLEWRSCTQEECFLITGLAEDGTVNPKNAVSLRQLLRRRLIVRAPQFRIMNESFRRFALAQSSDAMRNEWEADAARSGWGKARGAFSTVLVLVGLFLLATQQQFLQTSTGLLTAAGGCVAAVLKLIGVVQGRSSDT